MQAGFIPLLDCAPLVIAKERGFDQRFGFSLHLHREVSWANIRDKLDLGAFDCAHMLAPMPIAATLGLGRATEPVIAPMSLEPQRQRHHRVAAALRGDARSRRGGDAITAAWRRRGRSPRWCAGAARRAASR